MNTVSGRARAWRRRRGWSRHPIDLELGHCRRAVWPTRGVDGRARGAAAGMDARSGVCLVRPAEVGGGLALVEEAEPPVCLSGVETALFTSVLGVRSGRWCDSRKCCSQRRGGCLFVSRGGRHARGTRLLRGPWRRVRGLLAECAQSCKGWSVVGVEGVEPSRPRGAPGLESGASASSATLPCASRYRSHQPGASAGSGGRWVPTTPENDDAPACRPCT